MQANLLRVSENVSLTSNKSIHYAIIIVLCIFLAFSGYFSVELINDEQVGPTKGIRAVAILCPFLLLFFGLILKNNFNIQKSITYLLFFVFYTSIISVIINPPSAYLAPVCRWSTYFAAALYISRLKAPEKALKIFFFTTAILYILTTLSDFFVGRALHVNGAARMIAGIGSPTGLASALLVTALGILYFYLKERNWLLLLVLALLFVCITLTGTRSISVAFAIILPLYYSLHRRLHLQSILTFLISIILIGVLSWYVLYYSEVGKRLILLSSLPEDSSTKFRQLIIDTVASKATITDYIFGVGLGGFPIWFEKRTGIPDVAPHLEILWLIMEGGVIGILLYVIATIALINEFRQAFKRNLIDRPLYFLGIILLLAPQLLFQFSNPTYFLPVMLPIFFVIGFILNLNGRRAYTIGEDCFHLESRR